MCGCAQVPIFKQRRLNAVTRTAMASGSQAVVDAVVAHAQASTRGERELFKIVDVASEVSRTCFVYEVSFIA